MTPPLHLSCALPENLDEIMGLEHQGFPPGIAERPDVFLERLKVFPDGFLVARPQPDSPLIGYVCSELWEFSDPVDLQSFELNHGIESTHKIHGDEIYVSSMTINPALRAKGYGRALFTGCLNHLAGKYPNVRSALLIVNETWTHARNIYGSEGFQEIDRIKDFFTPEGVTPQDAIVMRRPWAARPSA